jgi:hypothetical protein
VRRPNAGKAVGFRFHHGTEVVAAAGTLLLHVQADVGEQVFRERLVQQAPIGGDTLGICGAWSRQPGVAIARTGQCPRWAGNWTEKEGRFIYAKASARPDDA